MRLLLSLLNTTGNFYMHFISIYTDYPLGPLLHFLQFQHCFLIYAIRMLLFSTRTLVRFDNNVVMGTCIIENCFDYKSKLYRTFCDNLWIIVKKNPYYSLFNGIYICTCIIIS